MTLSNVHWDELWRCFSANIYYKPNTPVISNIRKVFNNSLNGVRILEVGAGSGSDLVALTQYGAECYAVDFSKKALDVCKYLMIEKKVDVDRFIADCRHIPIRDNFFDLVFSVGLIEHFADPIPALKEQCRVLKSGGYLLIDVPQKYNLYTVVKHIRMIMNINPFGWETEYSVKNLQSIGQKLGLRLIHTYGWGSSVATHLPRGLKSWYLKAHAKLVESSKWAPWICLSVGMFYRKDNYT